MRPQPWLPLLAIALIAASVGAQQLGANYTVTGANATISSALAYVNMVNQSGYLVFFPNLTQAYSYLQKAQGVYNSSPAAAVFYANKAVASAQAQYQSLRSNWLPSFAVMLALSAASAAAVIISMRKAAKAKRKR